MVREEQEAITKDYWLIKIETEQAKEYFIWLVREVENGSFYIRADKK